MLGQWFSPCSLNFNEPVTSWSARVALQIPSSSKLSFNTTKCFKSIQNVQTSLNVSFVNGICNTSTLGIQETNFIKLQTVQSKSYRKSRMVRSFNGWSDFIKPLNKYLSRAWDLHWLMTWSTLRFGVNFKKLMSLNVFPTRTNSSREVMTSEGKINGSWLKQSRNFNFFKESLYVRSRLSRCPPFPKPLKRWASRLRDCNGSFARINKSGTRMGRWFITCTLGWL